MVKFLKRMSFPWKTSWETMAHHLLLIATSYDKKEKSVDISLEKCDVFSVYNFAYVGVLGH